MKFILASGNSHKKEEYEKLLFPHKVSVVPGFDADETGLTYKDNARIKLNTLKEYLKKNKPVLVDEDTILFADDSGLEIESHKEILGLFTSRFMMEKNATQDEKNNAIIELMQGEANRKARFVCHIAFSKCQSKKVEDVEGEIKGTIAFEKDGNEGFGYDPIFIPIGQDKTLSKLGEEYKSKHSHRANACSHMLQELTKN